MIHFLFQHFNDPLEDFTAVPPGILALKVMTYFAEKHTEDYAKVGYILYIEFDCNMLLMLTVG